MTSVRTPTSTTPELHVLHPSHFAYRHIGPRRSDVGEMLAVLGYDSIEAFIDAVVPEEIRLRRPLALPPGRSEREVLQALRGLAGMNRVYRSYIGMGYAGCFTPQVVQRNVLENPGLVHRLHAVPGGDLPGPAGGAAQLPDPGLRPHRAWRSPTPRCWTKRPPPRRRWRSRSP